MSPWLVSLRPPPRPGSHTPSCGEGPRPCHSAALTACHRPHSTPTVDSMGAYGSLPTLSPGQYRRPPSPSPREGGMSFVGGGGRGVWSRKRPGQSLGHFSPDTWAPTGIPSCYPPPPSLTPSPSFLMSQPHHPPGHSSKSLSVVLDLRVSVRPPCLPLSPPFLPTRGSSLSGPHPGGFTKSHLCAWACAMGSTHGIL